MLQTADFQQLSTNFSYRNIKDHCHFSIKKRQIKIQKESVEKE